MRAGVTSSAATGRTAARDAAVRLARRSLRLALCLAAAVLAHPACAAPMLQIALIEQDGTSYGRVLFERREDGATVRTREQSRLGISALGAREWRSSERLSSETADGRPLSQVQRSASGPAVAQAEARIRDGEIRLLRREGPYTRRDVLAAPADLLVDAGLQRRIAAQAPDRPWSFDYSEIDLTAARVVAVRMSSHGRADGDRLELLREAEVDGKPQRQRLYWSLSQQRLLPSWEIAGARFDSRACAEDCDPPARYYDLLDGLALPSPYRFPAAARRRTLRYVFENATGTAPPLPTTGEQAVVQRGRRSIVTICSGCGEETAPDADALARYRAPNAWVQSDHAALRALAREARANGSTEARMHKLVRFVQSYMTGERRSLGYASALQAAESRSGDCTEFALLLAALARAQQIPARVVGGLVYSSHFTGKGEVFSPHAWVQVWNGTRWISFDAGLGDFDSTHIVLAIGDGSAGDYAGLLRQVRSLRLVDAGQLAPHPPTP
ncbi:MAG: hypothetical protein BGP24_03630 [Lysobacterales bacterium 69-70]|nr:transglutaminase domain-containing protein [Xanthomonadaceae bacterium]ODU32105.1 MAG: hypothetical protein ABS97_17895 [Xanthomonadaceae bacterium SCN 69-320]ODV18965.1 MAG: hypothetical protein ABT27_12040 [Xanthomonadaceae bacterium SCN 69-25]OJZ01827.1 MAG: hypothetical protein BGP24_03630 [Xanthomonadales bacterium 69-70]